MTVSRLLARPMLASTFVMGGVKSIRTPEVTAPAAAVVTDKVAPLIRKAGVPLPEDPATLVRINGAIQLVGALALATGKAPRLGATALALSLVPTTLAGHRFWEASSEQDKVAQRTQFLKNVSMLGGLVIAAGDTNAKPGVAWRARRATRDARREARHLAGAARREAKLAKAKLS
ncbi:DoxX family protein [Nocardioides pantholopis]|uniref:DoxX family protein n=1 Tax=Nocardioides pantholopis TaxID=2483798 RepID=UPI000F07E42A|nr:DoxX family protein [Nocardioides pantholopis]